MGCTLNIPLGPSLRDPILEADIQARIDAGHKVWAVGDIHGHLATFRALIHRLKLSDDDRIICLGDMIDRGPDSAGLVSLLRSDNRIICLKGNHELMATQCLDESGHFEAWQPWMKRGGKSTYGSYIVRNNGDLWKAKKELTSDIKWMANLPSQLVLDDLRLVHAGYDPRMPLDAQGEKELLWIRKRWFNHDAPVDEKRCVIFGHSTTTNIAKSGGNIAHSKFDLQDGRPAWIAMDVGAFNHVAPGLAAIDIASICNEQTCPKIKHPFNIVRQSTLRSERWFDVGREDAPPISIPDKIHRRGRAPKRWKCADNRTEAHVADNFGLAILKINHRRELMAEIKKERRLRMAGLVFSSSLNEFSLGVSSLKRSRPEKAVCYTVYRKKLKNIHHSASNIIEHNVEINAKSNDSLKNSLENSLSVANQSISA